MTARLQHILFYGTTADPVCSALGSFRTGGRRLLSADASSDAFIRVYREDNNWVVAEPTESALVDLANEWELSRRRELYLFVSKVLWCSGFFVFISDWGYWGYEFFANGQVLDHFLQEENEDYAPAGLRAADCSGNIALLMKHFPFLEASSVTPYLVRRHLWEWAENVGRKVEPVHEGDEFDRFDEHMVLYFLLALGVRVGLLRDGEFVLNSDVYCTLTIAKE